MIKINFDINKWLKERRERQKAKLRIKIMNTCPHIDLKAEGEKCSLKSLVVSPSGTLDWNCQQCDKFFTHDPEEDFKRASNNNPDAFIKNVYEKQKKVEKLGKKAGYL